MRQSVPVHDRLVTVLLSVLSYPACKIDCRFRLMMCREQAGDRHRERPVPIPSSRFITSAFEQD